MLDASDKPKRTITLAATGASGSLFTREMLRTLEEDERVACINFLASDSGLRVMAEELGIARSGLLQQLLGCEPHKTRLLNNQDIGGNIASGSYPTDAMIVLPCSMGTLAKIAQGLASKLIDRAADVCLKERIPLVLCVRETPLNRIHLRNMSLAAEAGATIYPLIPAFYNHPASLEEIARQFVYRVLKHIGLPQKAAYVWKQDETKDSPLK
ncbi:MAG TPA: UbiX family flavin prenyltransferase [Candidatus Saccharimonadales bacterium]|nr:UbiX family flavin prenyltransferase [Candidatus Saccharimonadales bacterium]